MWSRLDLLMVAIVVLTFIAIMVKGWKDSE